MSCEGLTSVNIPNSVTSIGSYAFYSCKGLTSVTIPNSVMSIGSSVFSGCTGLTSVTIPNSVISIGANAFGYCENLSTVKFENGDKPLEFSYDGNYYNSFKDSNVKEVYLGRNIKGGKPGFNSTLTKLTISNSVDTINGSCFYGCAGLTSVKIPNSVTSIGGCAFGHCENLSTVKFEDGDKPLELGVLANYNSPTYYSFSGCNVKEVYLGRNIKGEKPGFNSALSKLTISNSVDTINGFCFDGCTGLKSVNIPNSVTNIGSYAFYGCTGLTSLAIPNSVTSIGSYAFTYCTDLIYVTIGDGVKKIGDSAFSLCSRLDNFVLGKNVESIGEEAFSDCTSMTRLVSRRPVPPTCGIQALDDINKMECTLYVPKGYLSDYQAADQWKEFFFMEEGDPTSGIASPSVNGDNVKEKARYTADGHRIYAPTRGLNIVKMTDGTVKKVMVK